MQAVNDNLLHGEALVSNRFESEGVLGADRIRISEISFLKTYRQAEGFRGVGEVKLVCSYLPQGIINFQGVELFSGGIGDRKGSLVFGLFGSINKTGVMRAEMTLDRGAGSFEFSACSGSGSFVIPNYGHCSFEFTFSG